MRGRSGLAAKARERAAARATIGTVLLVLGLVFGGCATFFARRGFSAASWMGVVLALLLAPFWIVRRGDDGSRVAWALRAALAFAACLVAATSAGLAMSPWENDLGGVHPWLMISALLLAAAFLVVPAKRTGSADWTARRGRADRIRALRRWNEERDGDMRRLCLTIVVAGVALVLVAALRGRDFAVVFSAGAWYGQSRSAWDLVSEAPRWAAAAATILVTPLWYAAWRKKALPNGRTVGLVLAAASALSPAVCALVDDVLRGDWWILLLPGALYTAAFSAAPAPRDPDALDAVETWRLLRRHRKSFPRAAR